jgi:hypothetical protein
VTLATGYTRNRSTVAHGLGYTPAFICYGKRSTDSQYQKIATQLPNSPADVIEQMIAWADSTNIYLEAQYLDLVAGTGAPSSITYNFKYVIFNNQIE